MNPDMPQTAFILAAGEGTRLRPLTNTIPKPMVCVNGKPLIGHIIDELIRADIKKIIINLFYKGEAIKEYVSRYEDVEIILSQETELLDTGGGVQNASHHIDEENFFLINGDAFWINDPANSLFQQMAHIWNPDMMDMLLLLQDVEKMTLTEGVGDYDIHYKNRAMRSLEKKGKYMFCGIRLVKKSILQPYPIQKFSFLEIMDAVQKNEKLYGHVFLGDWHHISTPQDLDNVNRYIDYA